MAKPFLTHGSVCSDSGDSVRRRKLYHSILLYLANIAANTIRWKRFEDNLEVDIVLNEALFVRKFKAAELAVAIVSMES